ncbi:MAG: porin, partial [Flavobacteriales bacterium]|nr:porin [Flavobacteriales bacterium]
WLSFAVSEKMEKFKFSASEELRLDENFSHINKVFTELGADYEIVKGLSAGFSYRFSRDNDYPERAYDIRHRIDLGIEYQHEINDLELSIKNKFQTKTGNSDDNNPTYNRTKLGAEYKFSDLVKPFVTYEFFYQMNDERIINRTRTSIGNKLKLSGNSDLKIFYIFENRFNTKNLAHNHIWGVSYSLDLN